MKAKITVAAEMKVGEIDRRVFGSFIEHLGRAVYGGIYEPGHPMADEEGFRTDVIKMINELDVPIVRYPGGNFVSGYCWEDGVGPVSERPKRLELAWGVTEPNLFGTNEFMRWCKKANTAPMMAVNLGTRGPQEARELVEYCNHKSDSKFSDMRIRHGYKDPWDIKLWCLGNEMDGPWQMGAKTATEYARCANEAAKLMKWTDPTIELVACGSSGSGMPTFGDWEHTVLNECHDNVDYLSLHRYYGNPHNDTPDFLASTMDLDDFIKTVAGIARGIKGQKHSRHTVNLSLDEWNVWYHSHGQDQTIYKNEPWGTALHLLEDIYNFEDALLVGLMLITILKNADTVKIACMAQLVNVIAPIMTREGGGAWAQTIYYPLMQASTLGRGVSLAPIISCEKADTAHYTDVPMVDAAAVQKENGDVVIFAVNRNLTDDVVLKCDLRAFGSASGGMTLAHHSVMHHDDMKAVNTEDNPMNVVPADIVPVMEDGCVKLPRASWNVLCLTPTVKK